MEQPDEPRVTLPVPQRLPPVVLGLEGLVRTVIWPEAVAAPLTMGAVETTRIR